MNYGQRATKVDFRGAAGRMLRGNKVYNGGATTPNPTGRNSARAAKSLLKKRGINFGK